MLQFPDQPATDYTDPNGVDWIYNGTGWVKKPAGAVSPNPYISGQPIIYEWDAISLYNGIYSPNIFPGSAGAPTQMGSAMRINNENHLMSTCPDDTVHGFYWLRNNGSKITQAKYLPYVSGENGQGNVTSSNCQYGLSRRSIIIGEEVYMLAGNHTQHDLIKITYDGGAELVAKVETHDEDDDWKWSSQYTANHDTNRPLGVIQSSDTEFSVAIPGLSKKGSQSYPMLKVKAFSKEDGSITNTYYSEANLTQGVSSLPETHAEFFPDPRDPKKLIVVCPYYWKDESPAYFHIVVWYVDTEAGTIETIDLGRSGSSERIALRGMNRVRIIPVSEDLYSVEVFATLHGYAKSGAMAFYVKMPADRQNMSSTISAGMNPNILKKEGKGYKDTYTKNELEIDLEHFGLALHKDSMMQTINTMSINTANTAGYQMYARNPSNYGIEYNTYAHKYRGYAVDGGELKEGLTGGFGMVDISPAIIAPERYFSGDYTTSHYIGLVGWRPDTGAGILALQDANSKSQYLILVQPAVPDNLRTMARVKDGKVVEGPLRGLEADVDTSGDDWFRVYPETKEVTTFGEVESGDYTRFVSDELVFDEDAGKVVHFFDEVAMTDIEVAEVKAMEVEELAMRGESE